MKIKYCNKSISVAHSICMPHIISIHLPSIPKQFLQTITGWENSKTKAYEEKYTAGVLLCLQVGNDHTLWFLLWHSLYLCPFLKELLLTGATRNRKGRHPESPRNNKTSSGHKRKCRMCNSPWAEKEKSWLTHFLVQLRKVNPHKKRSMHFASAQKNHRNHVSLKSMRRNICKNYWDY